MQRFLLLALLAAALVLAAVNAFARPRSGGGGDVERGRYLVTAAGCGDCHTPWTMGPDGPQPDLSRMLSGHPQDLAISSSAELPAGPWSVAVASTFTAWSGPWGTSFTANLTPDDETGLGRWSAEDFVATIRSGRHLGRGRQILPPMPYPAIGTLTDEDLRAVFAYLQSLPPIQNRVPVPLPPAAAR